MRRILMMLAAMVIFAGCEEQKHDVHNTVFAPQVKALEKARAVEDTVKQGAEKTRSAADAAGQNSESQAER